MRSTSLALATLSVVVNPHIVDVHLAVVGAADLETVCLAGEKLAPFDVVGYPGAMH